MKNGNVHFYPSTEISCEDGTFTFKHFLQYVLISKTSCSYDGAPLFFFVQNLSKMKKETAVRPTSPYHILTHKLPDGPMDISDGISVLNTP